MQVFKTKWFQKWASKEGLGDEALLSAINEMANGLIDADLGGHVVKKLGDVSHWLLIWFRFVCSQAVEGS